MNIVTEYSYNTIDTTYKNIFYQFNNYTITDKKLNISILYNNYLCKKCALKRNYKNNIK